MAGALDFLDSLVTKIGTTAGNVVETAATLQGKIAAVTNKQAVAGASALDQTPVAATSALQTPGAAGPDWQQVALYGGGALLLLGAAYLIFRRR